MRHTQIRPLHAITLVAILAGTLLATGCGSSVYHRTGEALPGEPHDRLALRVREARNAADIAVAIINAQGPITSTRAEQADAAAWEYSRRVASVQDIMRRLTTPNLEAQQVLASLEKAEADLNAAVEKLAAGDPGDPANAANDHSLAVARGSLASAMESADMFTDGHANAAILPPKGTSR